MRELETLNLYGREPFNTQQFLCRKRDLKQSVVQAITEVARFSLE